MEMAAGSYFDAFLKSAVQSGQVRSAVSTTWCTESSTPCSAGLVRPTAGPVHDLVNAAFDETLARKMSQEAPCCSRTRPRRCLSGPQQHHRRDRPAGLTIRRRHLLPEHLESGFAGNPDQPVAPIDAITKRAKKNNDTVVYDPGAVPGMSAFVASTAKVAVVFVLHNEGEFAGDRTSFTLPNNQDALVQAVAAANPNTVVVVNSGGPVTMPWLDSVRGVVEAWMPGEQDGNAIAGILFGDAEPGGPATRDIPPSSTPMSRLRPTSTAKGFTPDTRVRQESHDAPVPVRIRALLHEVRVQQPSRPGANQRNGADKRFRSPCGTSVRAPARTFRRSMWAGQGLRTSASRSGSCAGTSGRTAGRRVHA